MDLINKINKLTLLGDHNGDVQSSKGRIKATKRGDKNLGYGKKTA